MYLFLSFLFSENDFKHFLIQSIFHWFKIQFGIKVSFIFHYIFSHTYQILINHWQNIIILNQYYLFILFLLSKVIILLYPEKGYIRILGSKSNSSFIAPTSQSFVCSKERNRHGLARYSCYSRGLFSGLRSPPV